MKWALKEESKKSWVWEYEKPYAVDFYNPFIDFDKFALKLPGFGLGILRYWDGQGLRYVAALLWCFTEGRQSSPPWLAFRGCQQQPSLERTTN